MAEPTDRPAATAAERACLRELARRVRALAHTPANGERRAAWLALHDGPAPRRPMILVEEGGIRDRNRPFRFEPVCGPEPLRAVERDLRYALWWAEAVADDSVAVPYYPLRWRIDLGHYGVHAVNHEGDNAGHLGAKRWDPPLRDLPRDLEKLRPCEPSVDRAGTEAHRAWVEDLIGDLLPTRMRGLPFWTVGLTQETIFLMGLEELMLSMYDDPGSLHRLLAFQCGQWERRLDWLEAEGLVEDNNENDYVGSGSRGWITAPPETRAPGGWPRLRGTWGLSESQETVGVGPELFAEFVFPYQKRLADRFGWLYYGCCEPVHSRWDVIRKFGNLRAVSVSPWCDEAFMAAACAQAGVVSPTICFQMVVFINKINKNIRRICYDYKK